MKNQPAPVTGSDAKSELIELVRKRAEVAVCTRAVLLLFIFSRLSLKFKLNYCYALF